MQKSAKKIIFFVLTVNILLFHAASAADTVLVDFINLPFHIKTLASDSSGTIWISGGNGLFHFKGKDFIQDEESFAKHIINKDGRIIDIEEYGDSLFRNGHFPWYLFEEWDKFLPGSNPYITAGKDSEGQYWVGRGNNIFIFKIEDRFTQLHPDFSARGIYLDRNGDLYVNTYKGVSRNGEFIWENPNYAQGNIEKIGDDLMIAWGGVLKYSLESQKKESIRIADMHPNGELLGMHAFKVSYLNDTIWVATSKGLGFIQDDSLIFISDSIHIEDINYSEETNRYILATYDRGVLERKGNQIIPLNLPKYRYNQILYHEGKFYFTTSKGLMIWDGADQYDLIDQSDGLSSSMTYSILVDDFNFLWISTDLGLNRINLQTGSINHYLKRIEFNKRSKLKSGKYMFFGSVTGVFRFMPEDFIGDDVKTSLNDNRYLAYFLIFLFSLIGVSVLFWRRYQKYKHKKEEQLQKLEKRLFLAQIEGFIFSSNSFYSVPHIADYLGVSERQLYRIFEKYQITPGKLIKDIKLRKANHLIENHQVEDLESVIKAIGYSESYFLKLYREKYGNTAYLPPKRKKNPKSL